MLNFPMAENLEDWFGGNEVIQQLDRHRLYQENRRENYTDDSGFRNDISDDEDDSDELLPLTKTMPSRGKRQKYGSLSTKNHTTNYARKMVTHQLQRSDTLAGIAIKYNTSVEDIKRSNGLVNDRDLWPRESLQIPVAKSPQRGLDLNMLGSSPIQVQSQGEERRTKINELKKSDNLKTLEDIWISKEDERKSKNRAPKIASSLEKIASSLEKVSECETHFDPVLVGIKSGNVDPMFMWNHHVVQQMEEQEENQTGQNLSLASNCQIERKAEEEASGKEDLEIEDFFSSFDQRSANVTKNALKTLERLTNHSS